MVAVELAQRAAHGQGVHFGKLVSNAGTGHQEAVGCADDGDDDADFDEQAARGPENLHGHGGSRGFKIHQLIRREYPKVCHVDHKIHSHDDRNAAHNGKRKVAAGALHFACNRAHVRPTFKREKDGEQSGAERGARIGGFGNHGGEDRMIAAAEEEAEHHQQHERDQLADCGNDLNAACGFGAQRIERNKQDDDSHCNGKNIRRIAASELFSDGHAIAGEIGGVEDHRLHPACKKTELFVVNFPEICNHTPGFGDKYGDFSERERSENAGNAAENPREHAHPGCAPRGLVDRVWFEKYARTDHATDHDRHCGHHAKIFFKPMLFFH